LSDLGDRLKRRAVQQRAVEVEGPATPVEDRSDVLARLRRKMARIEERDRSSAERTGSPAVAPPDTAGERVVPDRCLPGGEVMTSRGGVWVNKVVYRDYAHGTAEVRAWLRAGHGLAVMGQDERLRPLLARGALFVDTETTGLSGGAGTLPFLVGTGWFEDVDFVVEHLFCRDPDEEEAQLELLAARMARASCLVSFNGKAFDIPLINTRFVLHRMANPGAALPHLDLLQVCRRIFSRRLNDRSLQNIERAVLGFVREGDIPGSLIPAVYVDWLRGTDRTSMATVLSHNALDIVALAALGGVLEAMYGDPAAVAHAADSLGLAQAALRAGAGDDADGHLQRADKTGDDGDRQTALHLRAKKALQAGDHEAAFRLWQDIVAAFPDDATAHLRLAKYLEHRRKDAAAALLHAERSLDAEGVDANERRLARLKKKMENGK